MAEPGDMEYFILRYVPNAVSDESAALAVIFTCPSNIQEGTCAISVGVAWQTTVRLIDPCCDLQVIDALLTEIQGRLLSKCLRGDMIHELEDSFSNLVQVSERRAFPGRFSPESCQELARELLEGTPSTSRYSSSPPHEVNLIGV